MKNIKITTERIKTEVITVTITKDKLEEWDSLFGNDNDCCLDTILYWIEEKFYLDCSPNHNTYFGDVDKDGGSVNFISDCDGSFWMLRIRRSNEN